MYEHVAGPGELQGVARNNSIESVLARAGNRVTGRLRVCLSLRPYVCRVAVGHEFNDGSKRTAYGYLLDCKRYGSGFCHH